MSKSTVRKFLAIIIGVILFAVVVLSPSSPAYAQEGTTPPPATTPVVSTPSPPSTPVSAATSMPPPSATPQPSTNIINIGFPSLGDLLADTLNDAAEDEAKNLSQQTAKWAEVMGSALARTENFPEVARASLPAAAGMAVALFLLRLVMYHWNRLIGESDTLLTVLGDWITAGAAAFGAGYFVDFVSRASWWVLGVMMGPNAAGDLANSLIQSLFASPVIDSVGEYTARSLFSSVFIFGMALAGLLVAAALIFAFIAVNGVLYVLAAIAPPIAILGVVPHFRWIRSLWIKAVGVIVLVPIVAGGVFKAFMGVASAEFMQTGNLITITLRLLWLLAGVGLLLSLTGILSRVTLSATMDAVGKAVQAVASVATLAAAAVGAGAPAAAAGAGAAGGGGGSAGAAGIASGTGGSGGGGSGAASPLAAGGSGGGGNGGGAGSSDSYLQAAQGLSRSAAVFDALGLRAPAQYARSMADANKLAAQQTALQQRMGSLLETPDAVGERVGMTHSQLQAATGDQGYAGSAEQFEKDLAALESFALSHGFSAKAVQSYAPDEVGRMARMYRTHSDEINHSPQPVRQLAEAANARRVLEMLDVEAPPATEPPPQQP